MDQQPDDECCRKPRDLKERTRDFALRIIRLYSALPKQAVAQTLGKQLLRSATSVGANYREAIRSRSKSEYAAKLNISLMELEESLYWLELLEGAEIFAAAKLIGLRNESSELTAIFVSLIKKSKQPSK
jgi:four helix bundle protein